MLNEPICKLKYNKTDYPLLEDRADGIPVPELWGTKTNITPVCIDTAALIYKWQHRESYALSAVRVDDPPITLVDGVDYTKNLTLSTVQIVGTPLLLAATAYYIVIEGDFGWDASNYIAFAGSSNNTEGVVESTWSINAAGAWSDDGSANDAMCFSLWGKDALTDADWVRLTFDNWSGWTPARKVLLDNAARTRIAFKITTPAGSPFYASKIQLFASAVGAPTGNLRASILSAYTPAEVQMGGKSQSLVVGGLSEQLPFTFTMRGAPSTVLVDATGFPTGGAAITKAADIIEDIWGADILGGTPGALTWLPSQSDFNTARPQALSIFIDKDNITFGSFISKMETSLRFKMIPNMAGGYSFGFAASGTPAGTLHFKDEDFLTFNSFRNWKSIFRAVKVSYSEDPTNNEFQVYESSSEIADFIYKNKEILALETYLGNSTDAAACAAAYISMLEYPQRWIEFSVAGGYGLLLLPFISKVQITRERADNAYGILNGELFRVFSVSKNILTGVCKISCLLDEQTY